MARVLVLRPREQVRDRGLLDHVALVHDRDPVAVLRHDPEIVGDEQHGRTAGAHGGPQRVQELGLDRHVEAGGRLVRDQQSRLVDGRHRDQHALGHAAGQLVRVRVGTPARIRNPDRCQRLDRLRACLAATSPVMCPVDVGDLVADLEHRVECRARVLDHQPHLAAADPAQLVVARVEHALALVAHRALGDLPRWSHQADHRQRRRRLARAGLTDEAHELALGDREREVLDGDEIRRADRIDDFDARRFEEGRRHGRRYRQAPYGAHGHASGGVSHGSVPPARCQRRRSRAP